MSPRRMGPIGALLLATCTRSPLAVETSPTLPDVSAHVVGAAAAALDRAGHFVLPAPALDQWGGIDGPEEARRIMEAASRMLATGSTLPGGGSLKGAIAAGHGKAIAWEKYRLSDDRRLLFGDTPYEYPQVDLPTTLRNAFGPHYFGVASAESPMVAAVALAASSGLYLEGEALRRDGTGGGELLTAPIGHRSRFRVPFEPEVAVAFAATATRSRITELPRLILPRLPSAPLAARWQLVLRRPVHLRRLSDGSSFEADTIYVAQDPAAAANGRSDPFHLLVPAADQPGTDQMSIGGIDYYFNRRPSVPLVFDEVEVVR